MKKYFIVLLLIILISPSIVFASWWNPISWFIKPAPIYTKNIIPPNPEVREITGKETSLRAYASGSFGTVVGCRASVYSGGRRRDPFRPREKKDQQQKRNVGGLAERDEGGSQNRVQVDSNNDVRPPRNRRRYCLPF